MWSSCTTVVFTVVAVSNVSPVHVLEFCESADPACSSHVDTASNNHPSAEPGQTRWKENILNLTQHLELFKLSCEKLIEALPVDEIDGNFVRTVKNCIFSRSNPTPLSGSLRLAAVSKDVIEGILDLDVAVTRSEDFLLYASGAKLLPGSAPLAHRYGGHQLGDGRAHLLGQYLNRNGETWELQLKGSGKTPYSRFGDGRAVIRSSVREFLCSEAMHFLGVPTSRAASLIVSEEPVLRDQFYNGNVKTERGAVVLRLAKSWFRFGSLEILAENGEIDLLKKLLNFVIGEHFSWIHSDDPDKYLVFFSTVVTETAQLIAQWISVGFTHGVCNTDNFSLLSVTIDYGPFGFMDSYDPNFVPNSSDDEGRYRIGAQAEVGLFNLEKLLVALSPVLTQGQKKQATIILKGYLNIYQMRLQQLFKDKLGFLGDEEEEEDDHLIVLLLKMMEDTRSDFTMTFRQLSEVSTNQLRRRNFTQMWALEDLSSHKLFSDWLIVYLQRLSRPQSESDLHRQQKMKRVNPRYVLRNWMAESAIRRAEESDFSEVELLHHILSSPFVTQDSAEVAGYAARPPLWANRLKVSCSS
ncbi:protein adenylyltransferase SelO-like isoform X2 [Girardinichthys multiradiatus]|uniref:protein adenylyltransferase SelO-like isoform X2 n=1 Tax=Girardinichthys multiradiatus TaxID=208333 RepID=UPI001FAB6A76|nr:protein adenylyltransferase SelO-like isoform X2 [Girardinichthys multiradiatus]